MCKKNIEKGVTYQSSGDSIDPFTIRLELPLLVFLDDAGGPNMEVSVCCGRHCDSERILEVEKRSSGKVDDSDKVDEKRKGQKVAFCGLEQCTSIVGSFWNVIINKRTEVN